MCVSACQCALRVCLSVCTYAYVTVCIYVSNICVCVCSRVSVSDCVVYVPLCMCVSYVGGSGGGGDGDVMFICQLLDKVTMEKLGHRCSSSYNSPFEKSVYFFFHGKKRRRV